MKPEQPYITFYFPISQRQKNHEYHLGVSYIQAFLKRHDIASKQIVPSGSAGIGEIAGEIVDSRPRMVGLTCYDANFYFVDLLSRKIGERAPGLPILIGGPTATFAADYILEHCPAATLCVRGEAEKTVLELVSWCDGKRELEDIEGITFRDNGRIVATGDRRVGHTGPCDLDIYPSPYLEGIPVEQKERLVLLTSRGCPHNCVYCCFSTMSRHTLRYHSVQRVVDEIEFIQNELKANIVTVGDEAFSYNRQRTVDICNEVLRRGLHPRLICQTRADTLDRELLALMAEAGVFKVNVGLESASPDVIRTIGKVKRYSRAGSLGAEREFIERVWSVAHWCREVGILPMVNVITGLPGESREQAMQTLDFVRRLDVPIYSHNPLRIYQGTRLFATYEKYGIRIARSDTGLPWVTQHTFDTATVPPMENSVLYREILEEKEYLGNLLSGGHSGSDGWIQTSVVLGGSCSDETLERLATKLRLNARLVLHDDNRAIDEYRFQAWRRKCVAFEIPSLEWRALDLSAPELRYSFLNEYWHSFRFKQLNASDPDLFEGTPATENRIAVLQSDDSLASLQDWLDSTPESDEDIYNPFADPWCIIKDECRLGLSECGIQAGSLEVICDSGVFPCVASAGTLGERLPEVESFIKSELEKRGCWECIVREECPKCPFLGSLNPGAYCDLMRQHAGTIRSKRSNHALRSSFMQFLFGAGIGSRAFAKQQKRNLERITMSGTKSLSRLDRSAVYALLKRPDITREDRTLGIRSLKAFIRFRKGYSAASIAACLNRTDDESTNRTAEETTKRQVRAGNGGGIS